MLVVEHGVFSHQRRVFGGTHMLVLWHFINIYVRNLINVQGNIITKMTLKFWCIFRCFYSKITYHPRWEALRKYGRNGFFFVDFTVR